MQGWTGDRGLCACPVVGAGPQELGPCHRCSHLTLLLGTPALQGRPWALPPEGDHGAWLVGLRGAPQRQLRGPELSLLRSQWVTGPWGACGVCS